MPVSIIENFQLGTNLPLDNRYVVDTFFDVSLYWFPGMQVFQTSDSQLYWYNGSIWFPVVDTSLSGNFATISYVDGSLAFRDASIQFLSSQINQLDASIQKIDTSLGDYVRKDGGTMSGDLFIQTDLSVNGKTSTGEFNVSGSSFPGSPSAGDLFYRTDLVQNFEYDASRGKWLSIDRSKYISGRDDLPGNTAGYFGIVDLQFTSTEGFLMPKNGTIVSASFINANTITRDVGIRVNNSASYQVLLSLSASSSIIRNDLNLDISTGDIIQTGALSGGVLNGITRGICTFEVAWRE